MNYISESFKDKILGTMDNIFQVNMTNSFELYESEGHTYIKYKASYDHKHPMLYESFGYELNLGGGVLYHFES